MSTLRTAWSPIFTPQHSGGSAGAHFLPLTAPQRLMDWVFAVVYVYEFMSKSTGSPSDDKIQVALAVQYSTDGSTWTAMTVQSGYETVEGTYTGVCEMNFPDTGGPPSMLVRFGLAVANKTGEATLLRALARMTVDGFITT